MHICVLGHRCVSHVLACVGMFVCVNERILYCVCVCVCVCSLVCVRIKMCFCLCLCVRLYACMSRCAPAYEVWVRACVGMCVYVYICISLYACMWNVYFDRCVYVHMCTYTHILYMHARMHVCMHAKSRYSQVVVSDRDRTAEHATRLVCSFAYYQAVRNL